MPAALKTFIDNGYTDFGTAGAHLLNARNDLYNLGDQIAANNWVAAETACDDCGTELGYVFRYLMQDDIWYHGTKRDWGDALYWINDNWPAGASITMGDILTAMLGATFAELTSFMGITQAYKVAVWDAPFNEEYYAALARGFRVWGT